MTVQFNFFPGLEISVRLIGENRTLSKEMKIIQFYLVEELQNSVRIYNAQLTFISVYLSLSQTGLS